MRNQSIDIAKGFLLLLVIIGHILQGTFEESLPRYLIYGFHMPMFMAISGYLFSANFNKIATSDWIKKIINRALLPWLLALLVFTVYLKFVGYYHLGNAQLFLEAITKPFYHLWFIPAWIGYQIILRWFEKNQITPSNIIRISSIITAISAWLQISGQTYFNTQEIPIIAEIFYLLRPQFFLFFILGHVFNNHLSSAPTFLKNTLNNPIHLGFAGTLYIGLFFSHRFDIHFHEIIRTSVNFFAFLYLNLSLLSIAFPYVQANELPKSSLLNWFGKQSLLIYLWHPLAIIFARYSISYKPTPEFYFSSITSTFTIVVLIYFYDRTRHP